MAVRARCSEAARTVLRQSERQLPQRRPLPSGLILSQANPLMPPHSLGCGATAAVQHRPFAARAWRERRRRESCCGNRVRHQALGGVAPAQCARCTRWSIREMSTCSSTLKEGNFHTLADETLEHIQDSVEACLEDGYADDFEVNMSQGVLTIVVTAPARGGEVTWVMNKQAPNQQVWWSSPLSGPKRFEWLAEGEGGQWVNTRDQKPLFSLLVEEMEEVCGVRLEL